MVSNKDYSHYPFNNFALKNLVGEEWVDMPQFDGSYAVSNYGRIWAYPRPVLSTTNQFYLTKERIRKQYLSKYHNTYTNDYTDQLSIHLRYGRNNFTFIVSRLVYHFFVAPLDLQDSDGKLLVVHKDGDNCNNHFENLELMNGSQLYVHGLNMQRRPRAGRIIKKGKQVSWSDKNSPRPIVQYTLAGKKIKEYNSVAQAATDNKTSRGNIRDVAIGKLIQSYGFVYRFKGTSYKGEHADFSYEKTVTQYHLDGKQIKVYPSVKEAALRTGFDASSISRCALHKTRICNGFVWRYKGDKYKGEFKGQIKNKARPITQYALDGKKIASFSSVNQASQQSGYTASTLLDCAYKRTRVAHGFVWRFEDESYDGQYRHYRVGKPVTQFGLNGKKIRTYPTIQAAADVSGLTSANIQKNVVGENKTAGGFIWKYATLHESKKLPIQKRERNSVGDDKQRKEVIQYSLTGRKLVVHKSISDGARATDTNVSSISSVVDKDRSAAGYVWRTRGNVYRGSLVRKPHANTARLISQYDLAGQRVQVYRSTRQAEKTSGASASSISAAARGKLKTTGGFIWKFGNGPKRIDVNAHHESTRAYRKSISKAVVKYGPEGKVLQEYPSIGAAARAEGISVNSISDVVRGKAHTAGGNAWRLKK